jgi:hypothetical protein
MRIHRRNKSLSENALSTMLHLNGHVRQRAKSPEQRLVVVRPTLVFGCDGHYGAQMAWPKAPQMQVGQSVAVDLDQRAHMLRHGSIGIHVEQGRRRYRG